MQFGQLGLDSLEWCLNKIWNEGMWTVDIETETKTNNGIGNENGIIENW